MLPSRALQLIREYSKPITRHDWRTCKRIITKETYENDITILDNLIKGSPLYKIVHRNTYDYLFSMNRQDLVDLIIDQENKTKYLHKIDILNSCSMYLLVLYEIGQERKMKQHEEILKQRKINNILKEKKRLRHRKTNYNET